MRRWFGSKRRLTVSFITRDSEQTLTRAIAQARRFADEVVVGVDADSRDRTWELAGDLADTVYRFKHPNQLSPAHMLALRYCRGEWILRLDDDEYMETGFEQIIPELLATPHFTHYYLSRKMVVSETPPRYMHALPWYPNYVLRLFRNDPSLIWKPPRFHSGYFVAGQGAHESRYSILHYEAMLCSPEQREQKLRMYRQGGGEAVIEAYYGEKTGEQRSFQPLPAVSAPKAKRRSQQIDPQVHVLTVQPFPAWGCRLLSIDLPPRLCAAQEVIATIKVTNTGKMTWLPQRTDRNWPQLSVGFHLKTESGELLQADGGRIAVNAHVPPNASAQIVGTFIAPAAAGRYRLSWDMFSENECWFEQCGSVPFDTVIEVESEQANGEPSDPGAKAPG